MRTEPMIGFVKRLRDQFCIADHRHKVSITVPTRYDVHMQMIGDTCSCDTSQVHTQVETVGGVLGLKDRYTTLRQTE
jgi:hypothetical protein